MENIVVFVRATVRRPSKEMREALRAVLAHYARSHTLTLHVDLPAELQTAAEAFFRVPAQVRFQEESTGHFSLRIAAVGRRYRSFPAFWGTLEVAPFESGAAVVLKGAYTLPATGLARNLEKTYLRRAAHSTMRLFLENLVQEAARQIEATAASRH